MPLVCNHSGLMAALAIAALVIPAGGVGASQRYQADEWIAECAGPPGAHNGECSITVPFWQNAGGGKGSFALVVMPQTGDVGLVGTPPPTRAVVRIDKNPEAVCRGDHYCIFPAGQAVALLRELENASLILVDVFTTKSRFSFSLSPKGYHASVAQIRAWGYQVSGN